MSAPRHAAVAADSAPGNRKLCAAIEEFAAALNPRRRVRVDMDTPLDRDLGLDSLSRMELLARLEREFGVSLPERDVVEAETPRDIARALRLAGPTAVAPTRVEARQSLRDSGAGRIETPRGVDSIVEALLWHADAHPERVHVHLLGEDDSVRELSYGALLDRGRTLAAGLRARGHEPGETVAIMLPTSEDYLVGFFGILLAGGIPVPIYPPARITQIEDHFRRHARILANARASVLVTFDQAKQVTRLLASQVESLRSVVTPDELSAEGRLSETVTARPDDVAFLQYTSGSTGDPKGVVLTHANLISNLACMREALDAGSEDVFVSWLPLYHDMGLIGAWLGSVVYGFPLVLMSPLSFLKCPETWLRAVHAYGGTLSGGPNFAFELCIRRIREEDIEGLDLGTWRVAFNGAEPVSPATLNAFAERFASYGFKRTALTPVYGLAEATLGVAFTPVGRGPRIDRVKRDALARSGRAEPADRSDADAMEFVSAGVPIPEFEVRIVDDTGHEAGEREEGALQFKGPSTTGGYFRNPEATQGLFDGDWLDSGDRGYIAEGELYLTGRTKDVIIRGGRNIHPYELEESVAEVEGVRRGCVALFGATDAASGTERLVLVAETREQDESRRAGMRRQIDALTQDLLGMPADDIVIAPPHTVLKTSSGKIRRAAMRELYEHGRLEPRRRAVWLQVLRLGVAALKPSLRRWLRALSAFLYAGYTVALVALGAAVTWPRVALSRTAEQGFRRAGEGARVLLRLAGIPLHVEGTENVPAQEAFVMVSNHASYLDGMVLAAALPRPVGFVAKRELAGRFFTRRFLERMGVHFVERFDRKRGVEDARAAAAALARGGALGYFPEGTLHRMPGLLPFQLGAFAAAVEAEVPVVPVVIRGTRSILRGDSWFARRGSVRIRVLAPMKAATDDAGSAWERAVALRDRVRAVMLDYCGEPDLAARTVLDGLKRRRKT